MKKAIIYILCISALPLCSQTEAGRILLGGQVGYTSNKTDRLDTAGKTVTSNKNNMLSFAVRGGYFIADNFAAGVVFGINNQTNNSESFAAPPAKIVDKDMFNTTYFGLFGRYYSTPIEGKFSFFGQADLTFNTGKNTSENTVVDFSGVSTSTKSHDKISGFGLIISPGVAYFLSDLVALEATFGALGFVSTNTKYYNTSDRLIYETKSNTIEATFSPSTLRMGITFYIGGDGGASSEGGKK